LAAVRIGDGKFFLINKSGKEITKPLFDSIGVFKEGMAEVVLNNKWGFINKKGKIVVPPKYHVAFPFENGLAFVAVKNAWCAYIDKKGKIIYKMEGVEYY
jgi:hypothetical protein